MEILISANKEEKIKEAYGEYWAVVKEYVDENGWCKKRKKVNFEFIKTNIGIQEHQYHHYYWRPNSLQGIENNNGWVKIESEDDVPEDYTCCWFIVLGVVKNGIFNSKSFLDTCLLYTSPSPRDVEESRMPSSA